MAERKSSEFAKQVQRKFSRAQEKVLQKFGKSEETRDAEFEICVQNLQDQQSDGQRIYKDLKAYLNAVRVMRDASSRLFQSVYDVYELDWEGGEDLGAFVEGEDLLWNDYEAKLKDQALLTIESYMSQFPDMREKVAKRGRKLVDYDSTRHHLESLQNAKKKDEIKIGKAEEEMKMTKTIFEDMNRELKEELPLLYDSRVGCYVTVFQAISNLREIFYKEMFENNKELQNIIMNLKAQHPDKNFVVKNFSRGTLKRRSLKDALSPRALRASFSELHMSYSSRGSLRREQTSSFRSEKGPSEVLSSPARPKPPKDSNCGFGDSDAGSFSEDNPDIERTPSITSAPVVDDTNAFESVNSTTKKDAKKENESTETKKNEPLPGSDHDGEGMILDFKGDLSSQKGNDNELNSNIHHFKRAKMKVLSFVEDLETLSTHPEELNDQGSESENGIGTNCKTGIEGSGDSCKENATNNQILNEIKEETF